MTDSAGRRDQDLYAAHLRRELTRLEVYDALQVQVPEPEGMVQLDIQSLSTELYLLLLDELIAKFGYGHYSDWAIIARKEEKRYDTT